MTRVFLPTVVKISQMTDPVAGTGTGNDNCSEACAAMVDCTYQLGPSAKAGEDPEKIMYSFTEYLNAGSDVSVPEDFSAWFPKWLIDHSFDSQVTINHPGSLQFTDCKDVIDRGHMAVLFVRDYTQLKQYDGGNPYKWNPTDHAGHYVMLVGYDDNFENFGQTVIVHDPLRGTSGQPWDYSWASFGAAGLADVMEVVGAPLPKMGDVPAPAPPPPPPPPPPTPDPLQQIQDHLNAALAQIAAYKQQIDQDTAALSTEQAQLATNQTELQAVKDWLAAVPKLS